MGTLFWIAGAIIATTVVLIVVFAVCLTYGAWCRRHERREAASVDHHAPLP